MVDVTGWYKRDWHGQWIWANYVTGRRANVPGKYPAPEDLKRSEYNRYILARHKFHLAQEITSAKICITADSRYKLYVNGHYVARGIPRCDPYAWYYEEWDIATFLHGGEDNVIAVHARYYGMPLAYYDPPEWRRWDKEGAGKGGIRFDLALEYADGSAEVVGSGPDTRVKVDESQDWDVPLKNDALGWVEVVDTRKLPKDWNEIEFEDSNWEKPLVLEYPLKTLVKRDFSPLFEEEVFPASAQVFQVEEGISMQEYEEIVASGEHIDFCIQASFEKVFGGAPVEVEDLGALLGEGGTCTIPPAISGSTKILLTFPREMVGYARLLVEGAPGTVIDVMSGENLRDDGLPLWNWQDQKRGFRLVLRGGRQFYEQWTWEGYLYLLVTVRNQTEPLVIHKICTNRTSWGFSRQGRFECSDPTLTRLWEACAYTLQCCAIDGYLDCPSREQRSYLGDAYTEALVASACWGEPGVTKKLIYDSAFGQRRDGMVGSYNPGDNEICGHVIPDYCFYWIQLAYDLYRYYGGMKMVKDLYPHFIQAVEWFQKYVNPATGLLEKVDYWLFIDWSPVDKRGAIAIYNAQFMDVLYDVAYFGDLLGDNVWAPQFRDQADRLKTIINDTFWDETEGVYRDCIVDGQLSPYISQHTSAYLALKGVAPPERLERALQRVFDAPGEENDDKQIEFVHLGHARPERDDIDVLIAQPFFMHHCNQIFAQVGRFDLMFKYFRKGWTRMLDRTPNGTIWESWGPHASLCHAWAATPAFDLSTHVLGIKPESPGFATVEISPHFVDLAWAKGVFPTCRGDVAVSWTFDGDTATVEVAIPADIEQGTFIPPVHQGKRPSVVQVNGESLDPTVTSFPILSGMTEIALQY